MADGPTTADRRGRRAPRPRLLLLSMYPLDRAVSGPTVRITRLRDELTRRVQVEVVEGHRPARRVALARYAARGRLRGVDGIYVEASTSLPAETDIGFLALARSLGIPVLTYVRDAYQLFGDYYRADTPRRWASARLFGTAIRLLRMVSSRVAVPSAGLADALGITGALLLPPGAPAPLDVPFDFAARRLLYVGNMRDEIQGGPQLMRAMERARAGGTNVELLCVCRPGEEPSRRASWLHVERADAEEIGGLLSQVIACVVPRPRSPYNDLAVPIKLLEYLAYGRPLLVTDCTETARLVSTAGCGRVVPADADGLAAGIVDIVTSSRAQLSAWATAARDAARQHSWARRADTILEELALRS